MTMNFAAPHDPLFRCPAAPLTTAEVTSWLRALRGRPYVPGSSFDVGAVLRVRCGGRDYYCAGVNVENIALLLSVHGEGGALAAMLAALGPGAQVAEAWVMAAPRGLQADSADPRAAQGGSCCGRCRQHLWECTVDPEMKVHLVAVNGQIQTHSIAALLPGGFSFASFNPEAVAARAAAARRPPPADNIVRDRLLRLTAPDQAGMLAWLADLQPLCYATGRAEVAVIVLDNDAAVAGVRFEDSAFTGLSALQGAVANAVTAFGFVRITHIFMQTRGHDVAADGVALPALSCLQTVRAFAASRCPVTLFTPAGAAYHSNVAALGSYAPTFDRPVMILRDGQLGQ